MAKKIFRTYENMFLDTLREIEPATNDQIARALGLNHPPHSIIKSLLKKGLIEKDMGFYPRKFSVKERVVSYER